MTGAAALALATLVPLAAAAPTPEPAPPGRGLAPRGRWHHELAGPPALRWSVLFRRTETGDETRLLVETPSGRFALLSTQPATGTATREEVTIPAIGESVSRVLEHRASDDAAECARVRPPDACVVLSGARGRLAAPLSEFFGDGASALRERAAGVATPAFLERLRGLAPALQLEDLAFYSEDFLALLDPDLSRPAGIRAPSAPRRPGCDFDAGFGYPCTADERRREEWLFRETPATKPR